MDNNFRNVNGYSYIVINYIPISLESVNHYLLKFKGYNYRNKMQNLLILIHFLN